MSYDHPTEFQGVCFPRGVPLGPARLPDPSGKGHGRWLVPRDNPPSPRVRAPSLLSEDLGDFVNGKGLGKWENHRKPTGKTQENHRNMEVYPLVKVYIAMV